jgi:hypothetical protein
MRFQRQFSAGEITQHYVCLTEANIDRDRQAIACPYMQESRLAASRRFSSRALINHALRY